MAFVVGECCVTMDRFLFRASGKQGGWLLWRESSIANTGEWLLWWTSVVLRWVGFYVGQVVYYRVSNIARRASEKYGGQAFTAVKVARMAGGFLWRMSSKYKVECYSTAGKWQGL